MPPFLPNVSTSGTVTHSVANYIIFFIRLCLDLKPVVISFDDFSLCLSYWTLNADQKTVSQDATFLFTFVLVDKTIDITMEQFYSHPNVPIEIIHAKDLKLFFNSAQKRAPITFEKEYHIHKDGNVIGVNFSRLLYVPYWGYSLQFLERQANLLWGWHSALRGLHKTGRYQRRNQIWIVHAYAI